MRFSIGMLLAVLFVSVGLVAQESPVDSVIQEVKQKYAPDRRTVVCDIEYEIVNDKVSLTGEVSLEEAKQELLERVKKSMSEKTIEDKVEVLPSKELGEEIYGIVNLSVANIRSKPSHPAELSTQSLLGSSLQVLKKKGGWYYVQTPDQYLGWLDASGLQNCTEEDYNNWIAADKIYITAPFDYVYKEPGSNAIISDVSKGGLLKLLSDEGDYYKVAFPDGREGYLAKKSGMPFQEYLESIELSADAILDTAYKFMGAPYLWGGTSMRAVDCSGFTKTVFFFNGIILPRDASQQVHVGDPVEGEGRFGGLEPGDLLFFGFPETDSTKERVTHVGIYIGDTEFIHSSGLVKINSFDESRDNFSPWRFKTFLRARRILTSVGENGVLEVKHSPYYLK